jgi:dihydrofolate reductase
MGKLIVSTQMTLDGVTDQIDGWFDAEGEHEEHAFDQLLAADALLLGRKTYEGLAGVWAAISGAESIFADRINSMPKYVASRPEIKRNHRGNLMSYGCGELAHFLAITGLLDEIHFWIHPIIWGNGVRPFASHGPVPLRMKSATTFRSGVTLVCYEPTPRSTD